MPRPGTEIISRAQPLPRSAPTETGVWFVVGSTGIGPTVPTLITSLTQYINVYGPRAGGPVLYDAVDAYFREGGSRVYVQAVPSVPSTMAAGAPEVPSSDELAGMTRAELNEAATTVGLSDPEGYATKAELVEALEAIAGAAGPTPALSDPGSLLDALELLSVDLGPGQVSIPEITAAADQAEILDHAAKTNRIALLDTAVGETTAAAIEAHAEALRTHTAARYGALFGPWATIPGVTIGTTRSIGYSAIQAGLIARSDVSFNPNVPAAGTNGQAVYALDLAGRYTDAEYTALNEAGANMARLVYGGVRTYGYRTLVDITGPEGVWTNLGNARLNMGIVAQADVIAESYVFAQLDGRRRKISQFGGELRAMLVPFYEAGALYGETAEDAFFVDVGPQVNTEQSIASGELRAVLEVRMSPFAELVVIEIVKVATTEVIPAAAA